MSRQILYGLLMWGVFFYSLRRGGWAERLAASSILIGTYLTVLVMQPWAARYQQIEYAAVLVDIAVFIVFLYISLRSERFWPLWLAAMQSLTILSHFALYVPHMLPWAYWNATVVWSYPMLVALGFSIYGHRCKHEGKVTSFPGARR